MVSQSRLLDCDECAALILSMDSCMPHFIDAMRGETALLQAHMKAEAFPFAAQLLIRYHVSQRHAGWRE